MLCFISGNNPVTMQGVIVLALLLLTIATTAFLLVRAAISDQLRKR